jgi:hypothetical protein
MSPEMFNEPGKATYSTDLWSLGVTMFELVTATLPFEAENIQQWATSVAGNIGKNAPSLLDKIDKAKQSDFDFSLAKVVAKALQTPSDRRYSSADDMHTAVFSCLVAHGKSVYSAYLSYRSASDAPLATLLFDELNHSVTPAGHQVTVYFAPNSLHCEDWEDNLVNGLLNSLCYIPILSYGATAPLAALQKENSTGLVAAGWDEAPLGLERLVGSDDDREDKVLQEMLIAGSLLERSSASCTKMEGERGRLKLAYPLLVGRQQPYGHSEYPRVGKYSDVEGGGGCFSSRPSPPNGRAAAIFLRDRAGLSVDAVKQVQKLTVKTAVTNMTNLQCCSLWDSEALAEAHLTKAQLNLVGKGYAGPPIDLDEVALNTEQVAESKLSIIIIKLQTTVVEISWARNQYICMILALYIYVYYLDLNVEFRTGMLIFCAY